MAGPQGEVPSAAATRVAQEVEAGDFDQGGDGGGDGRWPGCTSQQDLGNQDGH